MEQTLRELSGADSASVGTERFLIETRYTYSDMKFHALEYCRQKAIRYGYHPRIQSFQLPPRVGSLYALERGGDTLWAGARDGTVYIAVLSEAKPVFRRAAILAGRGILDLERAPGGALYAACYTPFGSSGAIYRSVDGGFSWEMIYQGDHPLHTVSFADPLSGLAAGLYGTAVVTGDGGRSWNEIDPMLFGYRNLYGSDASAGFFRLAGMSGRIYTSEGPEAVSWSDTSICSYTLSDIAFAGPDYGIAVGDSSVFVTSDGGISWNSAGLGSFLVSAAVSSPSGLAAGGRDGQLYFSSDGGINWNSLPDLSGESRAAILFAGPDSLLAAGDHFVTLVES
jgi:hypothetical protein